MSQPVRVVRPGDRTKADAAPGLTLETAASEAGFWAGVGGIEPGTISGWHHHGDWETVAYVRRGILRLESGPGGREVMEAASGDFVLIPGHAIHREGAAGSEAVEVVVVRRGSGDLLFNVEAPEAG
jgi:uncharacterized RmlC-like cupin family protein